MGVAQLEEALGDSTFSAETYRIEVPKHDGHKARKSRLRFSGAASLDGTNADDAELLRAARLGHEVRLIVVGRVDTKTYALNAAGEEMTYSFTVRVESVEAAELT